MTVRLVLALGVVAFTLLPQVATAKIVRFAIVVGNNQGSSNRPALRFAQNDARKFSRALIDVAGFSQERTILLEGKSADDIRNSLRAVKKRLAAIQHSPADKSLLVFYFSGHSDGTGLETGHDQTMLFSELQRRLRRTGADLTLSFIDACYSGAALREKGGRVVKPFDVRLVDELESRGSVTITSSASDEATLEADEVRGSYFTHHLVSGLRGAADRSGDAIVTLAELYAYAYHNTVRSSSMTLAGTHHPSYEFRLRGRGDFSMARLDRAETRLVLPPAARISVSNDERVVAELSAESPRVLGLGAGRYHVLVERDGDLGQATLSLQSGSTKSLNDSDLVPVRSRSVAMRGAELDATLFTPPATDDSSPRGVRLGAGWTPSVAGDIGDSGILQLDVVALHSPALGSIAVGALGRASGFDSQREMEASLNAAWSYKWRRGRFDLDTGAIVRGGMVWQRGERDGRSWLIAFGPMLRGGVSLRDGYRVYLEARGELYGVDIGDGLEPSRFETSLRPALLAGVEF